MTKSQLLVHEEFISKGAPEPKLQDSTFKYTLLLDHLVIGRMSNVAVQQDG